MTLTITVRTPCRCGRKSHRSPHQTGCCGLTAVHSEALCSTYTSFVLHCLILKVLSRTRLLTTHFLFLVILFETRDLNQMLLTTIEPGTFGQLLNLLTLYVSRNDRWVVACEVPNREFPTKANLPIEQQHK